MFRRYHCSLSQQIALLLAAFLACLNAQVAAQTCTTPVNMASNGGIVSGLTGFSSTGQWQFNQSLSASIYGTIYNTHAAVQNPGAAPTGSLATNYPATSTNSFLINESDTAADTLTISQPSGTYVTYTPGSLDIWFSMGWRQAGGTPTYAGTLTIKVNGTSYLTITTVAGNNPGNATSALLNGATFGSGSATTYNNTGGAGALSQWNIVRLTVPYTSNATPQVDFVMSGGGGISDDFAIDTVFVPLCPITPLTISKVSQVVSDPVNVTNPKAIPGATIRYCIKVTNPAGNPAFTNVSLSDVISALPITYVANSLRVGGTVTGSTCNSDGVAGGAVSSGTVTASIANLAAGTTQTFYFDTKIN